MHSTTSSAPIEFTVPGDAAPQGSKRAVRLRNGRTVLLESSKRLKPWRALVSLAAAEAWQGPPCAGAVAIGLAFVYVRPKSHLTTKGALRAGAPTHPGKPDIDKLCRGVLDGLTGIVYGDDAQVVALVATKEYGETAHTRIKATPLTP